MSCAVTRPFIGTREVSWALSHERSRASPLNTRRRNPIGVTTIKKTKPKNTRYITLPSTFATISQSHASGRRNEGNNIVTKMRTIEITRAVFEPSNANRSDTSTNTKPVSRTHLSSIRECIASLLASSNHWVLLFAYAHSEISYRRRDWSQREPRRVPHAVCARRTVPRGLHCELFHRDGRRLHAPKILDI